jgi:hypothetical protein
MTASGERDSSSSGSVEAPRTGAQTGPLQAVESRRSALGRRGIFAVLAAAVGAVLVHKSAPQALAATSVTLANDVGSTVNNETVSTYVHNTGANSFLHSDAAVLGESDSGPGVYGSVSYSTTPQVPASCGVYGDHGNTNGIGVYGLCAASGGTGVRGTASGSSGTGVYGASSIGIGVKGTTNTAANGQPAILGQNSGAGPGVQGFSSGTGSIGISGGTDVGVGFWGTANGSGTGVLGSSITGTGVWGQSQSFFAGVFSGPVLVQGNFTVTGAKSAAVRGADGGLKRMYSLESPESWFEDFGSSQLSGGTATVQLEPGFAGVVQGDNYRVFLTPQGDSNGLYVSNKTPAGFTVHEQQGGKSNVGFDYRVVAKRKDIPGARLEHVDEPPALPDSVKTPPTPPKLPELPEARPK